MKVIFNLIKAVGIVKQYLNVFVNSSSECENPEAVKRNSELGLWAKYAYSTSYYPADGDMT
jgi:hypothetical protein